MVLDLNKCLGCQTCTMACKKLWTDGDGMDYMYWNNVETRPGQGYPRNWDKIGRFFRRPAPAERNPLQRGLRAELRIQLRRAAVPGRFAGDAAPRSAQHAELG